MNVSRWSPCLSTQRHAIFFLFSIKNRVLRAHECVCNFLLKIISDNNFYYTFIIIYFYSHTLLKSFVVMCSHISKKSRMCIKSYFNYVIKIKSSAILLDIILLFMKFYNNFIDYRFKSKKFHWFSGKFEQGCNISCLDFFCIKIIN